MQESIVISTKNTASLDMVIDGTQVRIAFPCTDMTGYKRAVETFRHFDEIRSNLQANAKDKKKTDSKKGARALELVSDMIGEFQDLVKFVIGDEAWEAHFAQIAKVIPLAAWEALAVKIISAYAQYIADATSTEGKL